MNEDSLEGIGLLPSYPINPEDISCQGTAIVASGTIFGLTEDPKSTEASPVSESLRRRKSRSSIDGFTNVKKMRNEKQRKTYSEKKQSAFDRVRKRFGQSIIDELSTTWNVLETGFGEQDHTEGDGVIISMLNMGMSEVEIMSVVSVGSYRVTRLRKRILAGENWSPPVKLCYHAFSEASINFLYTHMKTWDPLLEQCIPCPHLPLKSYFKEQITWTKLYQAYKLEYENLPIGQRDFPIQLMAYSTFLQYVHNKSPGLRLTRTKQDVVCDSCGISTSTPPEERDDAQRELDKHNVAARDQCVADASYIQENGNKFVTNRTRTPLPARGIIRRNSDVHDDNESDESPHEDDDDDSIGVCEV